jgi:predicted Fe-Mo cluster-binding NifX family protein
VDVNMKVAVASENKLVVHQHFGRATQFLVYEIEDAECRLVEIRKNQPPCGTAQQDGELGHSEDSMQKTVDLLADCQAVVVARIGPAAVEKLSRCGIQAFVIPDFIDSAMKRLMASGRLAESVAPDENRFKWLK